MAWEVEVGVRMKVKGIDEIKCISLGEKWCWFRLDGRRESVWEHILKKKKKLVGFEGFKMGYEGKCQGLDFSFYL